MEMPTHLLMYLSLTYFSFFSIKKMRLEIGSSIVFYNTQSEHVKNMLKKGAHSFRDKACSSYSITKTGYRTVP